MHEIGYCEALLPAVERRAAGREVRRIGVRAGTQHRLVADVMQFAWSQAAADTSFADAEMVLDETPMHAVCSMCSHAFDTDDTLAECPSCGEMGARMSGGDEFALEWLEFADGREALDESGGVEAPPQQHDHHDHSHDLDELRANALHDHR